MNLQKPEEKSSESPPEPYWGTAWKLALWNAGVTGICCGMLFTAFAYNGPRWDLQQNLVIGAICSVVAALVGAGFAFAQFASVQWVKVGVDVLDPAKFPDQLREAISQNDYSPIAESPTFFRSHPKSGVPFPWTEVSVELIDSKAWIIGPLAVVEPLMARLQG